MRFFAPALQTIVNARALLEVELRQALKANEFVLHYQPQVDSTGLIGVEALIRWNHPRRGLLSPVHFIPMAEQSGLILPLGNWVLEFACAQIAAWARRIETAHLSVSVNISALQFRQPGFVSQVLIALDRVEANPTNLKLELTESTLVDNIEDVIAKISELKSHGIGFSLDDFGTGYSSLAYLKRLPLDQLKIDRSFVRDIVENVGSRAIAESIISLGRAMHLEVVAEGVETEEQRDCLAQLGCHIFQGYLYSCPLSLPEFELKFVERTNRNEEAPAKVLCLA